MRDGAVDAADSEPPDTRVAEPECETDDECDDGVDCTRDVCSDRGECRNAVDHAVCADDVFCNGVEQCDVERGCMPGPPETCNDDDVCTIDRCDEEAKTCRRFPRDFDEDGEADWNCEGGTDCDDRDPRRGMTVNEVCDDGVDNDCDGMPDMRDPEGCGRQEHDLCADALDVSAGGFFALTTEGASPDYNITCAPPGRKDIALAFTLEESRSLTIRTDGGSETYISLRSNCEDHETEIQCTGGFPGQLRIRSLLPGTYYAVIGDIGGDLDVEVEFGEATPPPDNETCETAEVIEPGLLEATFVDVADDLMTSCSIGDAADLVYAFTLDEEQDVLLSAVASGGESVSLSLRSTCDDQAAEVRCVRGAPVATRVHRVPAGTYFLVVEGGATREFDFTLDYSLEPPTDEPAGDSCQAPIELPPSTPIDGNLLGAQDDHEVSCGTPRFYRDQVYRFELTETSDATISVDGGEPVMHINVGTACGDPDSQIRCVNGAPATARLRGLEAGEYFVVVESFSGSNYTVELKLSAPTTPELVVGNNNCATAHMVPATGGLFSGDTTTLLNEYETRACGANARSHDAAFFLSLEERKTVYASTEGSSFDTVLHLHSGMCETRSEFVCDDDGGELGTNSVIERTLNPGDYYYIVDGWGDSSVGNYIFEVVVSDP